MEAVVKSCYVTALRRAPAPLFVALILLAAPAALRAQGGDAKDGGVRRSVFGSSPRPPDPGSINARQADMRAAERAAARKKAVPSDQARLALSQIAEDYRHIQVINNQMLGAALEARTLNYKEIAEATKEIGKRAARLRSNLSLPEPEETEEHWSYGHSREASQLKAALVRLDKLVMGFVMSPFFKNRDVLDAKAGAKACNDLEEIIKLSRIISGDAARLGKGEGKP